MDQRIALILGGTAIDGKDSIGAAICHFLQDQGILALPVSKSPEKVVATLRSLKMPMDWAEHLTVDVTDTRALEHLFLTIQKHHQRIDILVNAQGIAFKKPTIEMSADEWKKVIDINFLSVAMACQFAAKIMFLHKKGHIINISSGTALRGYSEVAAYGATKGALCTLTQHLATEWAQQGIAVNALVPGLFLTAINRDILSTHQQRLAEIIKQTPARRIGDDKFEDLRAAVLYLTHCTPFVNGQIITVDGGLCMSA